MYPVRDDEPKYAFLNDPESRERSQWGRFIELVEKTSSLYGQPLRINGEEVKSDNPNRYKQHGFHFTADNCIGCHACEAACSEKNNNPPHLAFRSVGYVEGGTWPAFTRLNISMACNHCEDPVCLKGCPTRAYTKFAEYGAVLQDPDICFGCGYCTWVCPYNAPQLDPVKGQVSKCNMCVDRLEAGLKPACVAACLGGALEFGVIENTPQNRDQAKLDIPGFPDPSITHPNIRFQQKKTLPREMKRTDSMPIKYHRDDRAGGRYRPEVDEKHGHERAWNWGRLLRSHENAHVVFTLSAQAVMGAFLLLILGLWAGVPGLEQLPASPIAKPLPWILLALLGFGLFKLNMHLGKPHRFYRGFNNLRWSPVSREIAGVSLFFLGLGGFAVFNLFDWTLTRLLAGAFAVLALAGLAVGSWYMYRLYRIPARPFWDHWQTASSFYGTMASLGSTLIGVLALPFVPDPDALIRVLSPIAMAGLAAEGIGLLFHARDMKRRGGEGEAAYYEQTTRYGKSWLLRNALLGFNLLLAAMLYLTGVSTPVGVALGLIFVASMLVMAYTGRILFYALVIPTTMPGAFFWKNRGFIEHAREIGLADREQVGVVHERHHPFRVDELLQTIRETSLRDMMAHVRDILVWKNP